MNKFTLPEGTTNRHQWHKQAVKAVSNLKRTFDMMRQLYGTIGVNETESLVSVFSYGADDPKNPEAVTLYNDLGERFNWEITRENAAEIAKAFADILPQAMKTIPVEDNRRTPEADAEASTKREEQRQEYERKASEKAAKVEVITEKLRAQYPNAIGSDSGKSSHARAAANFKRILTDKGFWASVTSDSYSMGDSVRAKVLTPDLSPEQREEIETLRNNFTYGTFDAMTDMAGYDRSNFGEAWEIVCGRSKHCFVEYTQSDKNKAAILAFLDTTADSDEDAYRVWTGAYCRSDEFWSQWIEDNKTPAINVNASGYSIEEHRHTKHGFQMFIVIPANRLERDDFNALRNTAKAAGGWYSRKWGTTPGGFAFKDQASAEQFAAENFGDGSTGPKPGVSNKFREMADRLQSDIEPGAFKESGTGVASKLVVIDSP